MVAKQKKKKLFRHLCQTKTVPDVSFEMPTWKRAKLPVVADVGEVPQLTNRN